MDFNIKLITKENFDKTIESNKLISVNDKDRIEDVIDRKNQWIEENSNLNNLHGYQFEFDVWNFFLGLEPNFINDISRNFKIDLKAVNDEVGAYQKSKETDIFAIFDRHIFIVECKSTNKKGSNKLSKLKNEINDLKILSKLKEKRIKNIFDESYIVVNMLFTRGYDIPNQENQDGAGIIENLRNQNPPIAFFAEEYMDYINSVKLESESAEFAYKQFLGFFRNEEPDFSKKDENGRPLKSPIMAFTSRYKRASSKQRVFTFSISPQKMLNISTVAHRRAKNIYFASNKDNERYYQRLLKKGRVKAISEYLKDNDQSFPNNILVSYRGKEKLEFEPFSDNNLEEAAFIGNQPGILSFYESPGTFHVIDGQHRLFGYTGLGKDAAARKDHRLIVTAFEGLSIEEEAKLFLEINNEAKSVHPSLIMEIEWAGQSVSKKNLANGIVFSLRDKQKSSLFEKIQQAEEGSYKLSPKGLQTSILRMELLNREIFKKISFNEKTHWMQLLKSVENHYTHINELLLQIEKKVPYLWNTSRSKSPGLLRDIIMGALLLVIDRVTIEVIKNNEPKELKTVTKLSKKYITKFSDNLKSCSQDDLYGETGILNLDFYQIKGGQASQLVGMYMIDQLFPKSQNYSNLSYETDQKRIGSLKLGINIRESERRQAYLVKNTKNLINRKIPILNTNRVQKGLIYHNLIKIIIENSFSLEEHYGIDPWGVLVAPCFCPRPGVSEEEKKKNPFYNYQIKFMEDQAKKGAKSYKSPFQNIEGIALYNLIANPAKHRGIKPADNKEARLEKVTNFIWENLLIFPEEKVIPKNKPEFSDNLWKEGANYIKLFYEYRSSSTGGSLGDPHAGKYTGDLEDKNPLFDFYEQKFKELVNNVKPKISFGDFTDEIDQILSDEMEE